MSIATDLKRAASDDARRSSLSDDMEPVGGNFMHNYQQFARSFLKDLEPAKKKFKQLHQLAAKEAQHSQHSQQIAEAVQHLLTHWDYLEELVSIKRKSS